MHWLVDVNVSDPLTSQEMIRQHAAGIWIGSRTRMSVCRT
jgi:hypothetical protein